VEVPLLFEAHGEFVPIALPFDHDLSIRTRQRYALEAAIEP
jgi:hypothetical protein